MAYAISLQKNKVEKTMSFPLYFWCEGGDLNPHELSAH